MNIEELFDFYFNETEGYWSITGYYGRDEEVVFPTTYKDIPVKAIEDWFSPYNKKIKRVIIPEGYTSIGEKAFEACIRLTKIKLPESLTSIGERTFLGCTGLTEIKFPEGITYIGEDAFSNCDGLTEINIPETLTSIERSVFSSCKWLTEVKLPKSLTSIEGYAFFSCIKLKKIILPESLTSIGPGAFAYCTRLKNIKLSESLTSIESCAFQYTGLTNIKIPENLTSIGSGVFEGCTELTEISVDENNQVFCSVDGVMFDKTMTTLICCPAGKKGKYSIPDGVIDIMSGAFDNCKLTGISFPESLLFIEHFSFYNEQQFTEITINERHPNYCSIDGVLFNKEINELIKYPKNKDKTDYTVPDGVIIIDTTAFYRCKHLINIVLPESLKIIDAVAFNGCDGLKSITLPMNLQYIGESAFEDCFNLETVTLSRKTRIGYKAFEGFNGRLVYRD